jgi:hypothetical protein
MQTLNSPEFRRDALYKCTAIRKKQETCGVRFWNLPSKWALREPPDSDSQSRAITCASSSKPILDSLGKCRFYPMVGLARYHRCHYKCTVYFDKVTRSDWPIPFTAQDQATEVVYIDHDHRIRCAGPQTDG